jgi:hypothetical protein
MNQSARFPVGVLFLLGGLVAVTTAVAPVEATRRDKDRPTIHVVSSSTAGVQFEYVPGPGAAVTGADIFGEARYLEFPGTTTHAIPGAPQVPVVTEQVLIPAGHDYHLEFFVEGERTASDLRFPRAGTPELRITSRTELTPLTAREFPPAEDRLIPESPVSWSVEEFRGQKLLLVTMAPAQHNPAAGTTQLFEKIRVNVTFSGGERTVPRSTGAAGSPAASDPVTGALLQGVVLNPEAAAAPPVRATGKLRAKSTNAVSGIPSDYFDDAGQWVKMRIRENGIYRITGSDLDDAGVSIASIDPATIRLFSGSGMPLAEAVSEQNAPAWGDRRGMREIAVTVTDNGVAGELDLTDEIVFYALGPDNFKSRYDATLPREWLENEHIDHTVTWLTWAGTFSGSPLRIPAEDRTPVAGDAEITVVQDILHAEKNDATVYDPVPFENGIRWEKWWWQELRDIGTANFWDIDLPDVDTSRPASAFIRWWGANWPAYSSSDPERSHNLVVTVNDTTLNARWLGGLIRYDMTVDNFVPRARNRITGRVPTISGTNRVDLVLLAWMEFTYWKTLSLARNSLWFYDDSAGEGPVAFRIAGAAAGATVWDVTDPGRPVKLDADLANDGAGLTLSFRVADPGGHEYVAVNPAGLKPPASVELDSRPSRWLRDASQGVDYIVITWDEFAPAAEQLATWRRTHLRGITETRQARTAVVKVTDIYDEFSAGMVDPTAIRNFLQYVTWNWGKSVPRREGPDDSGLPNLSYVCLIGDANRDARDYERTGVRNLVPTWQGGQDNIGVGSPGGLAQYSTDEYYGRMEGLTDRYTDLVIGRIPVLTAEQATQVVQGKVIRSEQFPGMNPNRNRAIIVADDVCQLGHVDPLVSRHIMDSDNVSRTLPPEVDLRKIYLYDYGANDCSIFYKPAAKKDLIRAMNEGGVIVNYIGHGSDLQMADEKVLEVADVTTLSNNDQLSVLIAASCSVGKFDRPNTEGLAEVLIKNAGGGAIATMAATHLSIAGENARLNPTIIRHLYPEGDIRSVTVGLGLLKAKLEDIAADGFCTGAGCDRQKKYLLLGDPASVLITPNRKIRFADVPDTLGRGSVVSLAGEVLNDAGEVDTGFQGQVNVLVQDQPGVKQASPPPEWPNWPTIDYTLPGATIFDGISNAVNGRFTTTFVVPVSLRGGPDGRIRAYGAGPSYDAAGALESIVIGGSSVAAADTTPPLITVGLPDGVAAPGEPVEVEISDASGINLTRLFDFRSVLFSVLDEQGIERFRSDVTSTFAYDPGSYTVGRTVVTLPDLPEGDYTLKVTATDNYNNRGEGLLEVRLAGASTVQPLSEVYGLPNPFNESTQITWAMSDAGSVKLSIFSVSGRKVREWSVDGDRGENRIAWDGTDGRGDAVANGVYLVRIAVRTDNGTHDIVEPIVRVRH